MFKVAVFSGSDFDNRTWRPGKHVTSLSVFCTIKIDFRQAQLEPGVTNVICFNVFGNTRLRVPEGMPVTLSGVSLFGRTRDKRDEGEDAKNDHALEIAYFNVFGATAIIN